MQTQQVIPIRLPEAQFNTCVQQARIVMISENGEIECQVTTGTKKTKIVAKQALSCLVLPKVGDRVLLDCNTHSYVLAVLERAKSADSNACVSLGLPEQQEIVIQASRLTLRGGKGVSVQSHADIDLTTPANISITASNLFSRISQSLIQLANHHMMKASSIALTASQFLRSHGRHHLISAEQDVKIDGERINMG